MDKIIGFIVLAYLVINTIVLEQTIRDYEENSISKKECTKLVKANNRLWEKTVINKIIKDIKK